MIRVRVGDPVYCVWRDITTEHSGWFDMADHKEVEELDTAIAETWGVILKTNRWNITIVSSRIQSDNLGSCDVTIPKSCIQHIEVLQLENEYKYKKQKKGK